MRKLIAALMATVGLAVSGAALADPPGWGGRHGGPPGHWHGGPPHAHGHHGPRFDHGHGRWHGPREVVVIRQPAYGYYPPPPPPVYYAPRVPVVSVLGVPVVTIP